MHHRLLFSMVLVLVIAIVLAGCSQTTPQANEEPEEQQETEAVIPSEELPPQEGPTLSLKKTCNQQNGFICDAGEECNGNWLEASDSFSCCSQQCQSSAEVLRVDPFSLPPENQELGDLT